MRAHLIIDLLKKDKVVGLDFLLVTGDTVRVNEIKKSHTNDKELFVVKPHEVVINLEHVVKINTINKFEGNYSF